MIIGGIIAAYDTLHSSSIVSHHKDNEHSELMHEFIQRISIERRVYNTSYTAVDGIFVAFRIA